MNRLRLIAATAALLTPLALAGCGDDAEEPETSGGDDAAGSASAFPVTIEHAWGETTIESKPERVAAVAWANHEVPLALGVVPVGMAEVSWGDDDGDGVLPWVEDKLAELDAETPTLFDETDGIDFEAVAATQPDVILASYSGITEEEYDTLSKIAPTIAYPDVAWGTSVQDMVRMNSEALGLADEGEQLVEDLDAKTAESLAEHPELAGKSIMFTYIDPTNLSQVGFYTTHDTRPGFLADVGMTMPQLVVDASAETEEFYVTRSAEEARRLPGRRHLRDLRRRGRRAPGHHHHRPGALADPGRQGRARRDPRGLDTARGVGQPVAALDRVGHRRLPRTARRRGRLTWSPRGGPPATPRGR